MSFHSNSFIYNRISSEQFGLELYDIDGKENGNAQFPAVEAISDKISRRYTDLHYGITYSENLKFNLVFGVTEQSDYMDAFDISVLSGWLLGHTTPKWLEICQPDMSWLRFHCFITSIEKIDVAGMTIAFSCEVECDSPFAHTYPLTNSVTVRGATSFNLRNTSSFNGYFYPNIRFMPAGNTTTLTIKNKSDNDRLFELTGLTGGTIEVDGVTHSIKGDNGTNLYDGFNYNYLRLVRGDNFLEITGDGTLEFCCEFPITAVP